MRKTKKHDCGCEFELDENGVEIFVPKAELVNQNCKKTWDLISDGNTLGCFQIDSRLGRQTCKKVKPNDIEYLADISTIIRPAALEAKLEDGKSITEHYSMRKSGLESISYFHSALQPILKNSYGLLLTQEQTIRIGIDLAGMSEADADFYLRKSIGKKDVEILAKTEKIFVEGCVAKGTVHREAAQQIFEWIKKGARYGFNQSHAISYSYVSYLTAYAKAHFMDRFYRSYLDHAQDKTKPFDEIHKLTLDARKNGIEVLTPDIRVKNLDFKLSNRKNMINFGLCHIKSIGRSVALDIINEMPEDLENLGWTELLFKHLVNCRKSSIKVLISCGAFDYLKLSRKKMVYELEKCFSFKPKELLYIVENRDLSKEVAEVVSILPTLPTGAKNPVSNSRRLTTVKDICASLILPPFQLKDSIPEIAAWEESFLGTSITCSKFDVIKKTGVESDCTEVERTAHDTKVVIGQVRFLRDLIDKNGDEMAFFTISDNSGEIDAVCFKNEWAKLKNIIKDMEILKFIGRKKDQDEGFKVINCQNVY